jgi:hypothetical protein
MNITGIKAAAFYFPSNIIRTRQLDDFWRLKIIKHM